jgi:lysophospholipase L1-like esterase
MTLAPLSKVVFFGDSICFGQLISPHLGWVTRISAQLAAHAMAQGRSVRVTNTSINGNTTRMALERMPFDVQSHGVDLCVVQFGLNDCNHWQTDFGLPRVSQAGFRANLDEIIERLRRSGARCIVLNTNHPTIRADEELAGTGKTYQQWNEVYNDLIRSTAAKAGADVILNDVAAAWAEQLAAGPLTLGELLLHDGLHLSEAGHDLYYNIAEPVVTQQCQRIWASVTA